MALYYFDTSALAKRYIDEPGGTWVRRIVDAQRVAVAALVQVELASIITRRTREGTILAPDATRILRQFGTDYTRFVSVQLTDDILSAAADLIRQTPIGLPPRSLDAIHLACALSSRAESERNGLPFAAFVSADTRLLAAARALGLPTDDPNRHP